MTSIASLFTRYYAIISQYISQFRGLKLMVFFLLVLMIGAALQTGMKLYEVPDRLVLHFAHF
jgi:hypothetical protein